MAIVPLFKHRKPFINVVSKSLIKYQFVKGRYFTSDPKRIEELEAMAKTRDGGIYIDPKEPTIDTEAADPVSMMKKTMREEIMKELSAQGKLVDESTTKQEGLGQVVSTVSSTITGNSAAEAEEAKRIAAQAEATAAATTDPALTALEKLKAGQK